MSFIIVLDFFANFFRISVVYCHTRFDYKMHCRCSLIVQFVVGFTIALCKNDGEKKNKRGPFFVMFLLKFNTSSFDM